MAIAGALQLTPETLVSTPYHLARAYHGLLLVDQTHSRVVEADEDWLEGEDRGGRRFADSWGGWAEERRKVLLELLKEPPPSKVLAFGSVPHYARAADLAHQFDIDLHDAVLFAIAETYHAHKFLHGSPAKPEWQPIADELDVGLIAVADLVESRAGLELRDDPPFSERQPAPRTDRRSPRVLVSDTNISAIVASEFVSGGST